MTEPCEHKNIELLIQDIEKKMKDVKENGCSHWAAGYYAGLKDTLDGIKFWYNTDCSICKKED
jgi:hypothetical protein